MSVHVYSVPISKGRRIEINAWPSFRKNQEQWLLFYHCLNEENTCREHIINDLRMQGLGVIEVGLMEEIHHDLVLYRSDVASIIAFVRERMGEIVGLIGHSFSSYSVLEYLVRSSKPLPTALINTPRNPGDFVTDEHSGFCTLKTVDVSLRLSDEVLAQFPIKSKQVLPRILFVQGMKDDPRIAQGFKDWASDLNTALSVQFIDGMGHIPADRVHSKALSLMLSAHFMPEIEASKVALESDYKAAARTTSHPYVVETISNQKFDIIADEPEKVEGGLDVGPSPYDFLALSLASCTAMTIKVYNSRKKWPIDEVSVHVDVKKQIEKTEEGRKETLYLTKYLDFRGDLSDDQRKRLATIADRCPVNRSLKADIVITSELMDTAEA